MSQTLGGGVPAVLRHLVSSAALTAVAALGAALLGGPPAPAAGAASTPATVHATHVAATAVPGTGGATASGLAALATLTPPNPPAMSGIEPMASYVADASCDGVLKPGTARLASLLTSTYAGTSAGTVRGCGSDGSISEHYDGRAVDWMTSVRTADGRARADSLIAWLFATSNGQPYANARRLGVMYLIWNNQIWGAYRPSDGWRPYSSCASHPESGWDTACHRDHIHISLSWEGAMGRTSYWTHSVAATDYGPCRTPDLTWAPPYTTARTTPCPSVGAVPIPAGASALTRRLIAASGAVLRPGSVGDPVAAVNEMLGLSGSTWSSATTARLQAFQSARHLAATGIMDIPTWRATTGSAVLAAASPHGNLDSVAGGLLALRVAGWAFDGETDATVAVRVSVDGVVTTVAADDPRPDVAAAFPGRSANHGFVATLPATAGAHAVCVTAVNTGAGSDLLLGCRAVTVLGVPIRVRTSPTPVVGVGHRS